MEHPALGHIEKTLADSYRKEIDQEENVWRSLPFFAATLALELAALFQLITRLPPTGTLAGRASFLLLILTGLFMFIALGLLAACIAPSRFRYISREPLLLQYTDQLIAAESAPDNQGRDDPVDALAILKRELAHQFSVATDHNRRINKQREFLRAFAGLAVIGSVMTMLLLVVVIFAAYYISGMADAGGGNGSAHVFRSPDRQGDRAARLGNPVFGGSVHPPGTANADHN